MCCNTAVWILFGTAGKCSVLHQERNTTCVSFMFVQFICSGSRWRFSCSCNWCIFVVLHNRICGCFHSLSFLLDSRDFQQSVQLVQPGCSRLSAIIRCTCSESALGRSIQNVRFSRFNSILPAGFQWCLIANPSTLWRKYHSHSSRRSLRTQPQPAPSTSVT